MPDRREFVLQGLAAAGVSGFATSAATAAMAGPVPDTPTAARSVASVVFDTRFADSVAFARALAGKGVALEAIAGDITPLWLGRLEPALRAQPQAIAGLSNEPAFLCLAMLASGHGLRTVFHGEHRYRDDGTIEHVLRAPPELLERAVAVPRWPEQIAGLVARYRAGRRPTADARHYSARLAAPAQPGVESLVSWVLAPLPRA